MANISYLKEMTSKPYPLGPSIAPGGMNFSIYVSGNKEVEIFLPTLNFKEKVKNKTGDIYHIFIKTNLPEVDYTYIIDGREVIDPYAPLLETSFEWGEFKKPFSKFKVDSSFDWQNICRPKHKKEDLIIYEMHVRGFTCHLKSKVKNSGKFLGIIDKIPHLLELGVNAVELLPIHEFNERDNPRKNPLTHEILYNYWGYDSASFFALMNRYGVTDTAEEFKMMVRELHRFGIEVILDVVYNHTSKESYIPYPAASSKYYLKEGEYDCNDSGCGNTLNTNHVAVQELILSSLRHLHSEFQVDGFRFDLATVLKRDSDYLIQTITEDPTLKNCKLIAEPWDITHYQAGAFYPESKRWSEWNDQFRDATRKFIRGDKKAKGAFADAISGSSRLYHQSNTPLTSLNFITSHDGFSMRDLVSYNQKHNLPNGENNKDGTDYNLSWNCGKEGPTEQKEIIRLRERQIKNFFLALLLAKGIPMITMGDEYGHTKVGNNNTWCQDNDLSWFNWPELDAQSTLFNYVKGLVNLRRSLKEYFNGNFPSTKEITWHSQRPHQPKWEEDDNFLAFTLNNQVWVAFNASDKSLEVYLPGGKWENLFHSSENTPPIQGNKVIMESFSSLVFKLLS